MGVSVTLQMVFGGVECVVPVWCEWEYGTVCGQEGSPK